jgi:hypothetical protein
MINFYTNVVFQIFESQIKAKRIFNYKFGWAFTVNALLNRNLT